MDVIIDSFSYEKNIPIVKWQPVKSGNCQVKYDLTIANQSAVITKEDIEGTSLQIPEMTEPTYVKITAIDGLRRGRVSPSKIFNKKNTTSTASSECPAIASQGKLRI